MKTPAPHCRYWVSERWIVWWYDRRETYGLVGALAAKTLDLAIGVDLVVLEDGEFGLFALVLDLLGGGVDLLFSLLATTTEAKHQVKGALLLDVVVGEGAAILELLAGEDQALLVRGNALLVLDLLLDIVDGVARLHLEGDSLAREGLHEDLHDCLLRSGKEVLERQRHSGERGDSDLCDSSWCCARLKRAFWIWGWDCDGKSPESAKYRYLPFLPPAGEIPSKAIMENIDL